MDKSILIMAAGMGSRYGGLKQIESMGPSGEILMEYAVHDALRAGFTKVVFVVKDSMLDDFDARIGQRMAGRIKVEYAVQRLEDLPQGFKVPDGREKPWGTGQAILCAAGKINEPFAVFNADDYYGQSAFRKMASWLDNSRPAELQGAMVGYRISNTLSPHGTVTRGICQVKDGNLAGVDEMQGVKRQDDGRIYGERDGKLLPLEGDEVCSMNFWGFTPRIFDFLARDFVDFLKKEGGQLKSEWLIPTIVDRMVSGSFMEVEVLNSEDDWFGVTYPEDRAQAATRLKALVEDDSYPSPLFPA